MGAAAIAATLLVKSPAVAQAVEAVLFKDADNPARQPFQADWTGRIWGPGRHTAVIARVPEGKRLVIEYASAWVTDYGYAEAAFEITTVQNGKAAPYMLPVGQQSFVDGDSHYIFGQPVRLYADPDTDVVAAIHRTGWREATDITLAVSGYFVNLP